MDQHEELALANYRRLKGNSYPGRFIVIGLDETGQYIVQAYAIMGRSPNSRNRVFEFNTTGRLWTVAADESKVKDPSLIIYNAMVEASVHRVYIVSNGKQTDSIADVINDGSGFQGDFVEALHEYEYEPDEPNFTPRISAISYGSFSKPSVPRAMMSILKKSSFGDGCNRQFFEIEGFKRGIGYCIHTYQGDGSPLPPFQGEPYTLPLAGGMTSILANLWEALDADNRVSLAVKLINIENGHSVILTEDQYEKVTAQ